MSTSFSVSSLLLISGCGNVDPNEYFSVNGPLEIPSTESETDTNLYLGTTYNEDIVNESSNDDPACSRIDWGYGCQIDDPTYNVSFEGLSVETNDIETVSLEKLHCDGYDAAVLVFGDADCSACPSWYTAMGSITDEIHDANGVIITACTDNFGAATLPHDIALAITENVHPDYTTGSRPLKYPCRYAFTPFTMVIDLSDATILAMSSTSDNLTITEIVTLVEKAQTR